MPDNDLWHVLAAIDPGTAALVACVFVLGGLVKGALGFGLPLATMAILPFFVAVDAALAINVVVLFLTNIAQFVQMGQMRATARRFAPVLGGILLGVPFGAVMVSSFSDRVLLTALGAVVVLFTIMSLVKVDLALAPRHERPVGWVAGVTGGIVGAMTTVGGPLFVMYLVGLGVERRVFLSALSLFFILSALLISGAFLAVGLFDATRLGLASVAFPVFPDRHVGEELAGHPRARAPLQHVNPDRAGMSWRKPVMAWYKRLKGQPMMDVKSLYTFISVVDHGSFALAAEALGLSASAISVQMRGLEGDVNMRLFDRSRRPPVLTQEGREFVERAREAIAIWEDLSDSLRRDKNAGKLRIGAVHTAVSSILPAALGCLRVTHPNLEIRLSTGLAHDLDAALRAGLIDVALTTGTTDPAPEFIFRTISEQRLVVLAHIGASGKCFREILSQNPYVRFSRHARVGELVERALVAEGIRVQSTMEVDTQDGVQALVAAGLGVSIVPEHPGLRDPRFRVVPLGDPPTLRRLGLMFDPTSPRRRFCDLLESELRNVAQDTGLSVPQR